MRVTHSAAFARGERCRLLTCFYLRAVAEISPTRASEPRERSHSVIGSAAVVCGFCVKVTAKSTGVSELEAPPECHARAFAGSLAIAKVYCQSQAYMRESAR